MLFAKFCLFSLEFWHNTLLCSSDWNKYMILLPHLLGVEIILMCPLLLKDFAPHLFKTYPNFTLLRKGPRLHSIVNLNLRHSWLTLISSYPYEIICIFTIFTIHFIFPTLLLVTDTWIYRFIVPQNLNLSVQLCPFTSHFVSISPSR